jgi:hypothetical protein
VVGCAKGDVAPNFVLASLWKATCGLEMKLPKPRIQIHVFDRRCVPLSLINRHPMIFPSAMRYPEAGQPGRGGVLLSCAMAFLEKAAGSLQRGTADAEVGKTCLRHFHLRENIASV